MSRRLVLVALCGLCGPVSGQIVFDPPDEISGTTVGLADVTGDGLADRFGGDSELAVFPGQSDGTFGPAIVPEGLVGPVEVADVNEDGVPDIVHGSLFSAIPGGVVVAYGLGGGSFAPPAPLGFAAVPWNVVFSLDVGDVNGDGHVDIGFTSGPLFTPYEQYVALGDGAGGFTLAAQLEAEENGTLALVDMDGDGLDDLVLLPDHRWRRSNGDGTFAPAVSLPFAQRVVGDVTGDARAELARVKKTGGASRVELFSVTATGVEQVAVSAPYPYTCVEPRVTAADLDSDGLVDLIVTCDKRIFVYRQGAASTFELASFLASETVVSNTFVYTGDVDLDGRVDLVSSFVFEDTELYLNATYTPSEPFTDLGAAVPGSGDGFPLQIMSADGADLRVRVFNVLGNAPAFAVVGTSTIDAPFKGGVLVPSPDVVVGPITTSFFGELDITAGGFLPLPPGLTAVVQWWIADPLGPQGFSATTAVEVSAP